MKHQLAKRKRALDDRDRRVTAREHGLAEALQATATKEHSLKQLKARLELSSDRLETLLQESATITAAPTMAQNVAHNGGADRKDDIRGDVGGSTSVESSPADEKTAIDNLLADAGRPVLRLAKPSPSVVDQNL